MVVVRGWALLIKTLVVIPTRWVVGLLVVIIVVCMLVLQLWWIESLRCRV